MSVLPSSLFNKQGAVAAQLAREFLKLNVEDRIPRIADYANQFGVGNGTVQAGLKVLTDFQAVGLRAHGQKGTHIEAIDYLRLWQLSGREVVFGAMALPYTRRYEGLATGLNQAFSSRSIPFALAFMRGAVSRAKGLKAGRYDFIQCSTLSADLLCKEDPDFEVWCRLGPGSHVSNHVLFLAPGRQEVFTPGMKVCLDRESIDQRLLTEAEFSGRHVEFVETGYMQIPLMLMQGKADAAVWNVDEILEKNLPLRMVPLSTPEALELLPRAIDAAIVVSKGAGTANFLRHVVDPEQVRAAQEKVAQGLMSPTY